MPIWKAARGYGDFANDPSLSPFEIALVAAWADGGAPEISDRDKAPGAKARTVIPVAPAFSPPSKNTRVRRLACGDQPLTGRLLAVQPQLEKGSSAGIAAVLPGGRREIVAWIRDFDPDLPATYWLRRPLDLPAGSRLLDRGVSAVRPRRHPRPVIPPDLLIATVPGPIRRTAP